MKEMEIFILLFVELQDARTGIVIDVYGHTFIGPSVYSDLLRIQMYFQRCRCYRSGYSGEGIHPLVIVGGSTAFYWILCYISITLCSVCRYVEWSGNAQYQDLVQLFFIDCLFNIQCMHMRACLFISYYMLLHIFSYCYKSSCHLKSREVAGPPVPSAGEVGQLDFFFSSFFLSHHWC